MGYTITFSDVMTVVISGALTIIVWFLKSYLSNIQATNEQQNKKLAEIDEKTQRRINAVEEESRNEIKRVDRNWQTSEGILPPCSCSGKTTSGQWTRWMVTSVTSTARSTGSS